jgi:DNA-binding PadR family transcriptional regulator
MESERLVESVWDTESTAGPARRVYTITDAGRAHLDQWAEDLRETDQVLHHFLETTQRTGEEDQV